MQKPDFTYHARHQSRNLHRSRRIRDALDQVGDVLDVGCNRGHVSASLITEASCSSVTGLDLDASIVDPELARDEKFSFVEGSIVDFEPEGRRYDTVLYLAVHHHVLRDYGFDAAIRVWKKLLASCRSTLFFETGHLAEGSRWDWQRALAEHFSTDEEHFNYLLQCGHDRITRLTVIDRPLIHLTRRWLLRLDLDPQPSTERESLVPESAEVLDEKTGRGRSVLFLDDEPPAVLKRYHDFSSAAAVEARVHRSARALVTSVPPVLASSEQEILIEAVEDARPMPDADSPQAALALAPWRQALLAFGGGELELDWLARGRVRRSIADLVDMNAANVLVGANGQVAFIDFEVHSLQNAWRNWLHLGAAELRLRPLRFRWLLDLGRAATSLAAVGIRHPLPSVEDRLQAMRPSLLRYSLRKARDLFDNSLGRLIPGYYAETRR